MSYSLYFLDLFLITKDIFFAVIILISIMSFSWLEKWKSYITKNKELVFINLSYSAALYLMIILNFYFVSLLINFRLKNILFDFSQINLFGTDLFKISLVVFIFFILYIFISNEFYRKVPFESIYILAFCFIGMNFFLSSFDFLGLFLSLELQNFSLYILMNMQRNKRIVIETCLKYYIIGVSLQR